MKKTTSGFTIVEILIVVMVIGVLVGIAIVSYNGSRGKARDSIRRTDIANIVKALETYYSDNGTYPTVNGSGSIKGGNWYTSGDSSWAILQTTLTTAKVINSVPTDPINTSSGYPDGANMYTYGLYVNNSTYCGVGAGQMYIILYRFEAQAKEAITDGSCASNELGSVYASAGASYYRSVKGA